jgi:hypothetical protein
METFIDYVGVDNKEDIISCLDICEKTFFKYTNGVRSYIENMANWDLSLKAIYDDKIVGCYILNEDSITCFKSNTGFDILRYTGLNGLHGVGLAVLEEYKGLGIGRALRDFPCENMLNYDYIFGMHLESLKNLENWKKIREVVSTTPTMHITLQDFSKKRKLLERV